MTDESEDESKIIRLEYPKTHPVNTWLVCRITKAINISEELAKRNMDAMAKLEREDCSKEVKDLLTSSLTSNCKMLCDSLEELHKDLALAAHFTGMDVPQTNVGGGKPPPC